MKNILIFGGAGFLGSALVKVLLKQYNVSVVYRKKVKLLEKVKNNKKLNLIKSDIKDIDIELLKNLNIDIIYHLASMQPSNDNTFEKLYNGNVLLTKKIVDLVKNLKVKLLVFSSTSSVYSEASYIDNKYLDEKSPVNPSNSYGLTKLLSEKLLVKELQKVDCKISIIRFPSIYGKNHNDGIIYYLTKLAKQSMNIQLYNKGITFRNVIFINSAVNILSLVNFNYEKLKKIEIFVAGSRDSLMLKKIVKNIIKLTNSNSKISYCDNSSIKSNDVKLDTNYANTKLNFKPDYITDGLTSYIKSLK